MWSRVEGSRCDPNPNEEFSRPDGESLFGNDGKLTPSITILGNVLRCFINNLKPVVVRYPWDQKKCLLIQESCNGLMFKSWHL